MAFRPHYFAFLFSALGLGVLIVANIGVTFNTTILPRIYLINAVQSNTKSSIRYGLYNSCLYTNDIQISCTSSMPVYDLGSIASIIGFLCGGVSLALTIFTYQILFNRLESQIPGLTHYWGPSLYLISAGCGCLLISFAFYTGSCMQRKEPVVENTEHYYGYPYNTKGQY
ncbi:hypothetical protein BDF14DRAFT_1741915 [Spinellus fusiger]|nr:hypothetical protein BDF14DRAFT_1741915 [Spinellus fusiger]